MIPNISLLQCFKKVLLTKPIINPPAIGSAIKYINIMYKTELLVKKMRQKLWSDIAHTDNMQYSLLIGVMKR